MKADNHDRVFYFCLALVFGLVAAIFIGLFHAATSDGVCTPSPYPSNALTIVGQQGRPLPATTVNITDLSGVPVTGYVDTTGCTPSTTVPPSGVYQFFTVDAGEWIVTVQGQGLTRHYYTTSGIGVSTGIKTVSIDRTADLFVLSVCPGCTLTCPGSGQPCQVDMGMGVRTSVMYDFLMPSFPLTFKALLVSFVPEVGALGNVLWSMDWCKYVAGDPPCNPTGANLSGKLVPILNTGIRVDFTELAAQWVTDWQPDDHIVVYITYEGASGQTTFTGNPLLENARMEFTR